MSTSKHLEEAGSEARHALSSGKESLVKSASEVSRHVRDAIEDAVEQGKTSSRHLSRQVAGTARDLAERGRSGARYVGGLAKDHAILSTLLALGAGLILARLLSRR